MPYVPNNVQSGAGTLYVAPLGTTEPITVTAAWPTGWLPLGYTEQGSVFSIKPTVESITPEEEYWPLRNLVTGYDGHIVFNLDENTERNWALALNGGIGSSLVSGATGTNVDGSVWIEPVTIGTEARVMLGWDSLTKGTLVGPVNGRLIVRQCFQTGQAQTTHRKGSNVATIATDFQLELPSTGLQPFRIILPPSQQY